MNTLADVLSQLTISKEVLHKNGYYDQVEDFKVKTTDSLVDDVKKYFYIWEGVNQKDPRYIDTFHKEVKSIMNQYNFDNGDSMSDYWHQNFFAFFDLDYPLLKKARVELGLIKDE